jgi:hypothetical protein
LLTSIYKRDLHLTPGGFFDINEEMQLRAAMGKGCRNERAPMGHTIRAPLMG